MNPPVVRVLSADESPLNSCRPARARELLRSGKARVYASDPFTIILTSPDGGGR